MSEFIQRRLMQLEPTGATLIVKGYHKGCYLGKFEVSTINLANLTFTRVRHQGFDLTWHYPGDLDTHTAAQDAAAEVFLRVFA